MIMPLSILHVSRRSRVYVKFQILYCKFGHISQNRWITFLEYRQSYFHKLQNINKLKSIEKHFLEKIICNLKKLLTWFIWQFESSKVAAPKFEVNSKHISIREKAVVFSAWISTQGLAMNFFTKSPTDYESTFKFIALDILNKRT